MLHRLPGAEIGGQRDRRDQLRQPEAVHVRGLLHGSEYRPQGPGPTSRGRVHMGSVRLRAYRDERDRTPRPGWTHGTSVTRVPPGTG